MNETLKQKIHNSMEKQKMSKRFECPYCTQIITLSFSILKTIAQEIEIREARCTECMKSIIEARNIIENTAKKNMFGKLEGTLNYSEWERIFPKKRLVCIDDRIDKKIRDGLNDAASILDIGIPDMAAAKSRAALEILLNILKIEGNNLWNKIENIKNKDPDVPKKLLHAIRECGNYSLHKNNEKIETTLEEAEFVIKSVRSFAWYWYIDRLEDQNMIEAIGEKKKENQKQI